MAGTNSNNQVGVNTHIDNVYNTTTVSNFISLTNSKFDLNTDLYQTSNETDKNLVGDILYVPNWSIKDFIDERLRYKSIGTNSINNTDIGLEFSDPGTYFYKLFFNFNTNFGLFGGIINNTWGNVTDNQVTNGPKEINTASMYLENNKNSERFSESYRKVLAQKQKSLFKFTQILNYLTKECPWVFKEIGGLETVLNSNFVDIAPAENPKITITFNQDAVDMRISTLIDLYKHACFDYTNYRVIIPENLRKFDMSIILYNPPIKGFNIFTEYEKVMEYKKNGVPKKNKTTKKKTIYGSTKDLNMCFKYIILKNCEIELADLKSFQEVISNESGFQNNLGISISYERSFIYNLNNIYKTETLDMYYNEKDEKEVFTKTPVKEKEEKTTNDGENSEEKISEEEFEKLRKKTKIDGKKISKYTDTELFDKIEDLQKELDSYNTSTSTDKIEQTENELKLLQLEQAYRTNNYPA